METIGEYTFNNIELVVGYHLVLSRHGGAGVLVQDDPQLLQLTVV